MDSSKILEKHAIKRLMKPINKLDPAAIETNVNLSIEGVHHVAKCTFKGSNGKLITANSITSNMYQSLDRLGEKLERQLKKYQRKSRKTPTYLESIKTISL